MRSSSTSVQLRTWTSSGSWITRMYRTSTSFYRTFRSVLHSPRVQQAEDLVDLRDDAPLLGEWRNGHEKMLDIAL